MARAPDELQRRRWLRRSISAAALGVACVTHSAGVARAQASAAAPGDETGVCNSLTGPFCLAVGATKQFSSYMTPITTESLYESAAHDEVVDAVAPDAKQCFFMHFASSWMDSGGDENDLLSKKVRSVDECEALCCEHPQCQSFTFWMGTTCFLRARHNAPREDGNSFSGNRIS